MTRYCRTQQISQMWLDFASEKTPCWQVQSTLNHVPKFIVSIKEQKIDTAIESLLLIRIPSLCNTFTSRTLSKMIWFWICKDQNDLLHTAQHAEPLVGHIWSHFDWKFQSRRDQTQDLLLARSQNTFLAITLRNQKMPAQIFYML